MEMAKSTERVDMSPAAVAARLRDLASLYALARSLSSAKIVGPLKADEPTGRDSSNTS